MTFKHSGRGQTGIFKYSGVKKLPFSCLWGLTSGLYFLFVISFSTWKEWVSYHSTFSLFLFVSNIYRSYRYASRIFIAHVVMSLHMSYSPNYHFFCPFLFLLSSLDPILACSLSHTFILRFSYFYPHILVSLSFSYPISFPSRFTYLWFSVPHVFCLYFFCFVFHIFFCWKWCEILDF